MILGPCPPAWVAADIAAEERRAWVLRLRRKADRGEREPDDQGNVGGVVLSSEELTRRRELFARAKAGEVEAERELWETYRVRVIGL